MPSTTRGSILISTANDIGEALVEKLGGVGYSPNEWKDKINLCGIAPVDSAPALSVLADSAGTGDERGSILIATADAIGAILNKKYNVLRGFKPKEWASACRKMKALEEGSVASASIASFSDGADNVPTKSLVVTIPPTLTGVSEVSATQTGENLVALNVSPQQAKRDYGITVNTQTADALNITSTGVAYACERLFYSFKKGTYAIKFLATSSDSYIPTISIYRTNGTGVKYSIQPNTLTTFTLSEDANIDIRLFASGSGDTTIRTVEYTNLQIEVGSTVSTYSQYNSTVYTANLGRTIYGGQVDIVNGTGQDENGNDFTFTGQEINTRLGYNAFWSDSGDTAVEYYQAPTPYARKTATGGIANFSDQRTDLPLTKAIANIAPSIAGKSAVNLVRTGASLANIADVSGNMTNSYFYNIGSDYVLTAGTTYKIAMEVNSTVTPFAVSVGVGDNAYRYDIYNTGINNKNGVVAFEFTVEASHLATWNKLWIRAPRYSSPSEPSTPTTCTFTVKNITLYSTATTYTAELGETVYGGSVDFVSGEVVNDCAKDSMSSSYLSGLSLETYIGYEAQTAYFNYHPSIWVRNWNYQTAAARTAGGIKCACYEFPASMNNTTIFASQYRIYFDVNGKNISSVQDFIDYVTNLEQNGKQLEITYELATPTESAIPGRVISPIEGVNNYWNDAGGDTEIQYFEDEA